MAEINLTSKIYSGVEPRSANGLPFLQFIIRRKKDGKVLGSSVFWETIQNAFKTFAQLNEIAEVFGEEI